MKPLVRLSIWLGQECKLAVDCSPDDARHFHVKTNSRGDYEIGFGLPFHEAPCAQANIYQASDMPHGVNTIDNPDWNVIGIDRSNRFVIHDFAPLNKANHFNASVWRESTPTPAQGGA